MIILQDRDRDRDVDRDVDRDRDRWRFESRYVDYIQWVICEFKQADRHIDRHRDYSVARPAALAARLFPKHFIPSHQSSLRTFKNRSSSGHSEHDGR